MALIIVLVWRLWNINLPFTTRLFGRRAISPFLGGMRRKVSFWQGLRAGQREDEPQYCVPMRK